jgi:hypothetical protein
MAIELSAELKKQLQASIKRYFVEYLDETSATSRPACYSTTA